MPGHAYARDWSEFNLVTSSSCKHGTSTTFFFALKLRVHRKFVEAFLLSRSATSATRLPNMEFKLGCGGKIGVEDLLNLESKAKNISTW